MYYCYYDKMVIMVFAESRTKRHGDKTPRVVYCILSACVLVLDSVPEISVFLVLSVI